MFSNASNFVHGVDKTFFIILGISFFFLILITFLMIFFVIKYNRKKNKAAVQIKDNILLEITWITIPVILVCLMFYYGYAAYLPMRTAPKDAMPVTVFARMWKWTFEYSGKKQSDNLVVPINKPVKLNLVSQDVIHGFFVPDFRIKEDVVPGKDNYTWFVAIRSPMYVYTGSVAYPRAHQTNSRRRRGTPQASRRNRYRQGHSATRRRPRPFRGGRRPARPR